MGDYCWDYAEKLVAKAKNFCKAFFVRSSYFGTLDNEPITAERFVDSEFRKYIENDGNLCLKVGFGAFFLWSKQRKVSFGWFGKGGL